MGALPSGAGDRSEVKASLPTAPALSASEKLAASRSALRGAMLEIVQPSRRAAFLGSRGGDLVQELLAKARLVPGVAIVVDSVEGWWKQHPLRTAGVLVGGAARAFASPMTQRNLGNLVLGAAAVGALFALTRPWRWLLRPALFVGLLPQLVSQVMKHMPIESWVRMATSMLQPKKAAQSTQPIGTRRDPTPPRSTN